MREDRLGFWQVFAITVLFWTGNAAMFYEHSTKQDHWIMVIAAALLFLPVLLLYLNLLKRYPGKNLFEIIILVLGNVAGKIVVALFLVYFLVIVSLSIQCPVIVIEAIVMHETPLIVMTIMLALLCVVILKHGVVTFGRLCGFYFMFTLFAWVITLVFEISNLKVENLLPIMTTPLPKAADSIFSVFVYPFGEGIMLFAVIPYTLEHKKLRKSVMIAYAFSALVIIALALRNIMILGGEAYSSFYFPVFVSANLIKISNFFQRIEAFTIGIALIASICKVCIGIFAISDGISKITGETQSGQYTSAVTLLAAFLATNLASQAAELVMSSRYLRWAAIPFQVLIPAALLVISIIINKSRKDSSLCSE